MKSIKPVKFNAAPLRTHLMQGKKKKKLLHSSAKGKEILGVRYIPTHTSLNRSHFISFNGNFSAKCAMIYL